MTLQLAVKITGDASSLTQAATEGTAATKALGTAAQAAGGQASAAAGDLRRATEAAQGLASAQRELATAATAAATAQRAMGMAQQAQAAASVGRSNIGVPGLPAASPVAAQSAAMGLRPDQWKNLGFQANDIATSLFSGIPVTQVIAQQGGQVAQVLGDAPGGIAGGLKIIAGRAAGLVTPFAAVTASAVALGAAFVYAGSRWDGIQDRIKRGLTGIGRQSGATADDIEGSAVAAASGNLTRADARDAALAAASTGRIGPQNLAGIAGLVPGFAQLTGSSSSEAGAELARIFADPTKGAEEMAQRIGALSDKTVQYVKVLDAQGNRQGAIAELARASQAEIARAAELTSGWARAWTAVRAAAGGALDVVGKVIVGGTPQEQIAQIDKQIEALRKNRTANANPADATYERELRASGLSEELIRQLVSPTQPGAANLPADNAKQIAVLEANKRKIQEGLDKQSAAAAEAQSNETSRRAGDAIRGALPDLNRLQDFRNTIEAINKALADPAAKAGLGPVASDAQRAIDAAQGALNSYVSAEDKARASEALTIRSIMARTDAEKAAIAAERERLNISGEAMSDSARRERIEAARQAVLAQSTREGQDRLRGATATNAAAGLLSYPRQIAELEARYRDILLANPSADNQRAKGLERQAIDKEAIGGPLRDANRALTEQVAALKLQQDAFGASTEAAARMAEGQRLVNQYNAAGVPISADMKRAIDAQAVSVGKVTAAQEELTRKQREVIGGLDDIRSGSRNALTGIFSDVSQGKSPLDGLTSSLSGMASRVFDRTISTPLVNSAFGLDGKAGGGMFGDALSGIFGKQQGLSTADITAGIVNVNGTVNANPGLSAANGNVPGAASAASVAAGLTGTSSSDMDRYAKAIRTIESGSAVGNYEALGKITKTGDRAYGAYQVMGNNIPSWTQKALGRTLTPEEFLKDKAAQDAVFQDQFSGNVKKYGSADEAASVWLSGRTIAKAGNVADANGTTPTDYVAKFNRALPPAAPAAAAAAPAVTNLDASLQRVSTSATTATQGVTSLTSDLGTLPNALTQTSQGVTQLGNSLGSNGGGLSGILAGLFGGGGGGSTAAVAAATGGHITGPGTGTSDSIHARLSNGEFVVKAAVTQRNLPFLHALNNDRLPAFAEGGLVGMAVPPAARRDEVERQRDAAAAQQAGNGVELHVHDNVGVEKKTTTTRNERGGQRMDVFLDQAVADVLNRPGSASGKALSNGWGMQRSLARRS